MKRWLAGLVCVLVGLVGTTATALASKRTENASCMGLGASFYGQFAPRQMAFVADFVNATAKAEGAPPGETYSFFAREKEDGAIPPPCGTRLE